MKQGLINRKSSVRSKCQLFHRTFTSIEEDVEGSNSAQFTDIIVENGKTKVDEVKSKLRENLLGDIAEKLHDFDIKRYELPWTGDGVHDGVPEHQEYMDQFVADFTEGMKRQINLNKHAWNIKNPLYEFYRETRQHSELCESHHKIFSGRQELLDKIRKHLTSAEGEEEDSNVTRPLFISGETGMGKSCLLSAIVKLYPHWHEKEKAATVVRFIGTTIRSSRMRNILVGICKQVCHIYHMEGPHRITCKTPDSMVRYFFNMLEIVSKHYGEERPLLIAIDGIEKFGDTDRADTLFWLPHKLPRNIHLVLTVASEDVDLLNRLKHKYYENHDNFITVSKFSTDDLTRITQRVLDAHKRKITAVQSEILRSVCNAGSHPLFVHHMLCEALGWSSSHQVGRLVSLPDTLEDAILSLLYGLEDQVGGSFVKHFVLYMSFFSEGLSEMELRDLLLQTPCVVEDLFKYSRYNADQDNVAAVLSMLLSQVLNRLKHQTKRRSRYNKLLYTWNHPQYRQICLFEYCKITDDEQVLSSYPAIMDMFTFHEGVNVKATTEAASWKLLATEISPQYLHASNLHKLHLLPTLIAAASPGEYMDKLKETCLCNFQFLVSKLMGMGVEPALKDINSLVCENDIELNLLKYFLKVCFDSLSVHPQNLASQLLGCVPYLDRDLYPHMSHMLDKVVVWLMESETPLLLPLLPCFQAVTEPCRSKLHNTIELLTMNETGTLAVMKSKDGYIEVWDMIHEERAFYLGIKYDKVTPNIFVSVYRVLGINSTQSLKVWEIKSGRALITLDLDSLFGNISTLSCICHTKEFELLAFHMSDEEFNQRVVVVDTERGDIVYELSNFDVKDEFFSDSAMFYQKVENGLLFVNARSVVVGEDSTEDIINLSYHNLHKMKCVFSVQCGSKKFKKLLEKDGTTAIISWQNCSFDIYSLENGDKLRSLPAPEKNLFCQSSYITEDGFLVALATANTNYALWFWELEEQVSSQLFAGAVSTKETDVPRDFIIIEDLHIAVLGTPESSQMMVWDLPTSECIYKHHVHSSGLDRVIRSKDPYMVYTCSSSEKLVKLWDLYAVMETHKHSHSQSVISFNEADGLHDLCLPDGDKEATQLSPEEESSPLFTQTLEPVESVGSCPSPNLSTEGILKRPGSSSSAIRKRPKSVRFRDQISESEPEPLEVVPDFSSTSSLEMDDSVSLSGSLSQSLSGSFSGSLSGTVSYSNNGFLLCLAPTMMSLTVTPQTRVCCFLTAVRKSCRIKQKPWWRSLA